MNNEPDDILWRRLARALFGDRKSADESLFTYRVMEEIRALQPALNDLAWHRFLRWAVPMLGLATACLILAARMPAPHGALLMENVLFQKSTLNDDPLAVVLKDLR